MVQLGDLVDRGPLGLQCYRLMQDLYVAEGANEVVRVLGSTSSRWAYLHEVDATVAV